MTKKSLVFLQVFLMLCSDVQMETFPHFDGVNLVRVMEFSYWDNKTVENELLPVCGTCKYIIRKSKAALGKTLSKDAVSRWLDRICGKIKLPGCRTFVQKYKNKLINALISGDDARTICIKLKLCKKMYM